METLTKLKTDFLKEACKPEYLKKYRKIPLVTGYALFCVLTSFTLVFSGIHILIESGVPVETIVQLGS